MNQREMFEAFDPKADQKEARKRWGHTKQFQESVERTSQYTQEDWAAMFAEGAEINQGIAALMDRSPADPAVQVWIGKCDANLNKQFFTCSPQVYRSIGDGYVTDQRTREYYENI